MLKIKTLIKHLCLPIISDSVAVEIFAIGQPCAKIFRKVRCATFLRHGVVWTAWWRLRHAVLPDHKNEAFLLMKCIWRYV